MFDIKSSREFLNALMSTHVAYVFKEVSTQVIGEDKLHFFG